METGSQTQSMPGMPTQAARTKPPVLKSFPGRAKKHTMVLVVGAFVVVVAGILTGWMLSGQVRGSSKSIKSAPGATETATEAGIDDTEAFPDEAEGLLKEGGIDGEGTHYLERPGGEDKYVYLTSTVIDLQNFVGKQVHIWGQTIAGDKAGWLMDVGRIKVAQ